MVALSGNVLLRRLDPRRDARRDRGALRATSTTPFARRPAWRSATGSNDRGRMTTAAVTEVTIPAAYPSRRSHDVAVLELRRAADVSGPKRRPIPLATSAELPPGPAPRPRGRHRLGRHRLGGHRSNLPARGHAAAAGRHRLHRPSMASYVSARSVCAGGTGAAASDNPDTCQGDSGGPAGPNGDRSWASPATATGLRPHEHARGLHRVLQPDEIQAVIEGTAPPSSTVRGSENRSPVSGGQPLPADHPGRAGPGPAPAGDRRAGPIRPTARLSRLSCTKKRRRCTFRVRASDNGARKLRQALGQGQACRRVGSACAAPRTRRSPRRISGGFAITATLTKATYRLNAVATDAAGNRSRALTKKFRVR